MQVQGTFLKPLLVHVGREYFVDRPNLPPKLLNEGRSRSELLSEVTQANGRTSVADGFSGVRDAPVTRKHKVIATRPPCSLGPLYYDYRTNVGQPTKLIFKV